MTETTIYNGKAPFVAGSDTSQAAAESVNDAVINIRGRVLEFIKGTGNVGATCDEVEQVLSLRHQTASARVRELALMEQIEDSGDRRKTRSGRSARVYVGTEKEQCAKT